MTISLPSSVEQALNRLHQEGFEAWIVGGCVRDALLKCIPKDFDLTTSARPEEIKQVFSDCHLIETGIRHGTVTVVLEGEPLEITTYRVDGTYSDARHPDGVTFTSSLREDAARRDFTMNAMAYAPQEGLQDFFGGQADVKEGILRCVGDPERRFREDALRILRALRFASVLGFSLERETELAAHRCRTLIEEVSMERISAELEKLLCGKNAGSVLLAFSDVLGVVIPEILPMVGFCQHNRHHCYDLLTHTAVSVDAVPPRFRLRLTMLLHDVGKPDCFTMGEDGEGHFYGHAHRSMELAEEILKRLHIRRKTQEEVCLLIRYHDAVLPEDPRLLHRWLSKLGEEMFWELLAVKRADTMALDPSFCTRKEKFDKIEQVAHSILAETPCLQVRDLAVGGRELMARGFSGRAIGEILQSLLQCVLDGVVANEKKTLLQFIEANYSKKRGE